MRFHYSQRVRETGDGNQKVAAAVSDLILDIAFFPSGCRIAEDRFETIVFTEPDKPLGQFPPAAFDDLSDNGGSIIEPDFPRHASYMAEDGIQ